MANYIGTNCITGEQIVINPGSNIVNPNEIWFVSGEKDSDRFCVTINSVGGVKPSFTAVTIHASCEECLTSNSLDIELQSCNKGQNAILPFSAFTSVSIFPIAGNVFYFSLSDGRTTTSDCYSVLGTTLNRPDFTSSILSFTSYSNCKTCNVANLIPYLVEQCTTLTQFYVLLPLNFSGGNFISFNEIGTLNQLCGQVIAPEPLATPTGIYLGDFNDCEECLAQTSVTRELISCITNEVEIVWASALYNLNQSSYLTISDPNEGFSGCYRIGELSSDPVTVTGYLSYSPSPSCEDCISCNGFEFEFFVCGETGLTGSTYSRQYIEIGHSFYHPVSGCCEVSQIITADTSTDTFYSFYEYDDCDQCTGSTINYENWVATDCRKSSVMVLRVPSGYSIGDVVTVNTGVLTTICATLDSIYASEPITTFAKTTEVSYGDCGSCRQNTIVAYPFAKCGENTATYYNISLENYYTILDNINLGKYVFTNSSFDCYFILNGCATPQYQTFIPINFFIDCAECGQPLSAGTPTAICIICCPCSTGETATTVYGPHPTWTNQYGKSVSMLDAVVIGGPNGLNS